MLYLLMSSLETFEHIYNLIEEEIEQLKKQTPTKQSSTPKRRKKNHYFTKDHENAIIAYSNTTCIRERTRAYMKIGL